MEMIKVQEQLPSIGKDVICFGIDDDGDTKVEEGFRSEIDDPKKPYEWADFSYTVLYWIYSPEIEVEKDYEETFPKFIDMEKFDILKKVK